MGASDLAEFQGLDDAGEADEAGQIVLVGAPSVGVVDIRKPLGLSRDVGQLLELGGAEDAAGCGQGRGGGEEFGHGGLLDGQIVLLIKYVINNECTR